MSSIFADLQRPRNTSPKCGGRGEVACRVSTNQYSCAHHVTWSPNKLWRSTTSIFNLGFIMQKGYTCQVKRHKNIQAAKLITKMFHLTIHLLMFRYIYDLTEQDSSRSREIERVMREARLRELCKVNADNKSRLCLCKIFFLFNSSSPVQGVYSTTYSDHIMSKVSLYIYIYIYN